MLLRKELADRQREGRARAIIARRAESARGARQNSAVAKRRAERQSESSKYASCELSSPSYREFLKPGVNAVNPSNVAPAERKHDQVELVEVGGNRGNGGG